MHLIIGLILSGAIGLSLGLIGGGGSIITVPVLVYIIGVGAHEAIGMSLAVVGITSLIGVVLHSRYGTVEYSTGMFFGTSGILGAFFGSRLTYLVSPAALMLSFATLMLFIAVLMLMSRQADAGRMGKQPRSLYKAALAGLIVGGLTGFLGVGGGFLIVPALLLFGGLAMKEAISTSLLVISINCGAGVLGHLHHGGFDPYVTMLVTLCAVTGSLLGSAFAHSASPARLRTGFALFVLTVAVVLIGKNYAALL